jgi:dsRNA-specific ribonuclease
MSEPTWPEGYLSAMKDKIVSNSRLFRASVEFGLDQYIVTKAFTHKHWRPVYVDDVLRAPPSLTAKRQMSTKTLADVIEALIGASFLEGGLPKALSCMCVFLPEEEWQSTETARQILFAKAPENMPLPLTMESLEDLIGYTFTKKSLLIEAMTHSSYTGNGAHASFDRLEFLGDAILDYIVVSNIFCIRDPPLEHSQMHLLRTALVNGDFLAFIVMNWSMPQDRVEVVPVSDEASATAAAGAKSPILERKQTNLPLWSFMRHGSAEVAALQRATGERFAALGGVVRDAIWHGGHYPWTLLSRLQCQKFYSDVFESVLGAVWVDSGSQEVCTAVLERVGILPYLRRLVADDVHLLHPKEELGRLAAEKKVVYNGHSVAPDELGEREFLCRVSVGGEVLGEAAGAFSSEEAKMKAAEMAVRALKERQG